MSAPAMLRKLRKTPRDRRSSAVWPLRPGAGGDWPASCSFFRVSQCRPPRNANGPAFAGIGTFGSRHTPQRSRLLSPRSGAGGCHFLRPFDHRLASTPGFDVDRIVQAVASPHTAPSGSNSTSVFCAARMPKPQTASGPSSNGSRPKACSISTSLIAAVMKAARPSSVDAR